MEAKNSENLCQYVACSVGTYQRGDPGNSSVDSCVGHKDQPQQSPTMRYLEGSCQGLFVTEGRNGFASNKRNYFDIHVTPDFLFRLHILCILHQEALRKRNLTCRIKFESY